ncbi:MAG: hypothetical protein AAF620_02180 [Bacteroidota bacterium]
MKKLLLIVLITACASSQEEKLYDQSIETHDLAIKIGERVGEKIKQIEIHSQTLDEPLKTLLQDSLKILTGDYAFWKSTIVEVPGHEHDHHEDDHREDDHRDHDHTEHDHAEHEHNHTPAADLTPEMMLDIQKDLRGRILGLNIRVQKILEILEENNKSE